jgi:hypothetical protein
VATWALLAWVWSIWQPDPLFDKLLGDALCGVIWLTVAFGVWFSIVGNPFEELALIRYSHTAEGYIIDTWEDVENGDEGGSSWFHSAAYKYRVASGREFTNWTRQSSGRLRAEFRDIAQPLPIQVEYLPDSPEVSRIKGSGSPNLFDWLWRIAGLGSLLLAVALAPGCSILRGAVRGLIKYHGEVSARNT